MKYKLVKPEPKENIEFIIDEKSDCDMCQEEKKRGLKVEDGWQKICFDCVEGMYKIMIQPAD